MVQKVGTSFAAPQAAGVAAMMLAVNPSLSVQQLIDLIKASSRHTFPSGTYATCTAGVVQANCACTSSTCGSGILDAAGAVSAAAATVGAGVNGSAVTSVSYFIPSRIPAARAGSGGGGGAMEWPELLALISLTAFAACMPRRSARRQSRQAAKPLP
jgi:serine protease